MTDSERIDRLEQRMVELASLQQEIAIATKQNTANITTLTKDIKVLADHSLTIAVMENRLKTVEGKVEHCTMAIKKMLIGIVLGAVGFIVTLVLKLSGLK